MLYCLFDRCHLPVQAPLTEVHKYGFLPQGVYSREDYARRLMQQPAKILSNF